MSPRTRSFRRYTRIQYNTDMRLWRYVVDATVPVVYDADNVPTRNLVPTAVWTGKLYLSPSIFSRQRREWPDPEDFSSYQDVAFFTAVAPFDMMPQGDDYLEQIDERKEAIRYFSQVSPPKDEGTQGICWHLDLSQPLLAAPA